MESKHCGKCKRELDVENFNKSTRDKLNSWCKECCKEYRLENKEKQKEYMMIYHIENKERLLLSRKKYREANKDYFIKFEKQRYENRREYMQEYLKEYGRLNKDKINGYNHKKRAIKMSMPHTFKIKQWREVIREFENQCAYCGKTEELQQEHFIALSMGGEYTKNNIIPACKSCNCSKHNKDFFYWYPLQSFYLKSREQKILKYLKYENNQQQLGIT